LLVLFALALGAFVISWGPIADGDIYWHLAAGRAIVEQRALPRVDSFTVSAAGRPWVDVHWLFQLGAFGLHSAFGFVGLVVAKALLVAGGALLLAWAAERSAGARGRTIAALLLLSGLILGRHLVPLRPGLLTMLFLAVFLLALEEIRRAPRARWPLFVLPLVQILWCNSQGLAPLGPTLVALYLGSTWLATRGWHWPFLPETPAALRPLAVLLVSCLVASLLTPYGLAAVALPVRLLLRITPGQGNVFSSAVAENIPPFVLERTSPELVWHFKWALGLVAALVLFARPRFHLAHVASFLAFLALALLANRNLPLFYWMAAPLLAIAIAGRLPAAAGRRRWRWARALALALLLGEGGMAAWLSGREPRVDEPTPFHFPVMSARRLAELRLAGPVFAPDHHGGYLTFTVPGLLPYLDTRLVLHSAQEYADYLALFAEPARFDALAQATGFRAVVLPTANPDRPLGLIWHLAQSPRWHLAYTDGYEVLFLRDGPALALGERTTVAAVLAELATRFGAQGPLSEAARLHLARLLVLLGRTDRAAEVLATLSSNAAAHLRARAHLVAGEPAAAEALARVLLAQDPRDLRSLCLLAESAAGQGRVEAAKAWLGKALALDPYNAEARSLLERMAARR
jgi:hypothetical protein